MPTGDRGLELFRSGAAASVGIRWTPKLPGRLGGLVQKNLRQMLSTLDFWAALLLTVSGTAYRVFGGAPIRMRS